MTSAETTTAEVPRQRHPQGHEPVRRRPGRLPSFCLPGLSGCAVEPVGRPEARWMATQRELVADLCDGSANAETLADVYSRVHQAWLDQPTAPAPDALIALFGLALGDLLIRRVPGLGWVLVSDDQLGELALTHFSAQVAVFPLSAVAERWRTGRADWLLAYVEQVVAAVRSEAGLTAAPTG
ncbi:MAG: DUF3806 domain-containing protein [Actinobacteria bacterium]|nr:DUF3806 domain-containing protein [Actinomycetota bacterium]